MEIDKVILGIGIEIEEYRKGGGCSRCRSKPENLGSFAFHLYSTHGIPVDLFKEAFKLNYENISNWCRRSGKLPKRNPMTKQFKKEIKSIKREIKDLKEFGLIGRTRDSEIDGYNRKVTEDWRTGDWFWRGTPSEKI